MKPLFYAVAILVLTACPLAQDHSEQPKLWQKDGYGGNVWKDNPAYQGEHETTGKEDIEPCPEGLKCVSECQELSLLRSVLTDEEFEKRRCGIEKHKFCCKEVQGNKGPTTTERIPSTTEVILDYLDIYDYIFEVR